MMPMRRGKTPPKTILTVRREIRELEQLADEHQHPSDKWLHTRILDLKQALLWQQGRATERPVTFIRSMSTVDGP